MAGKYEQPLTDQDFINGVIGSASRLKMNMESIIEKYDRNFPNDDLIDLYSMNIVQKGNEGSGFIRKTKPHTFGASKLKYTERKDALLKLRMNIQPSEFNPDVSMATAREGESVLLKSKNLSQEPSDAETLSSHDEDDVDEDEEEDGEEEEDSMSDSYGEEDDDTETSAIDNDFKSLYNESQGGLLADPKLNDGECNGEQAHGLEEDMEDEIYDADEEDFKSDEEGSGRGNTGHSLMKKEGKRLSPLAIISTKKVSNTTVNHSVFERKSDNFSRTFSHVGASFENNDATEDDSFVSISSNRSRPAVGSVFSFTYKKANTSVNDTFLISANISAALKKSAGLNFDNSTLLSPIKSLNGIDRGFKSPHAQGLTVKRSSSNLFKGQCPNTFASPKKPMPQPVNGKTLPITACGLSEALQEFYSSGSDTSNDDFHHQNNSNTQILHIANLPHNGTKHTHSSKPVHVDSNLCPNSRQDICQEVLSTKSLEGNSSDNDDDDVKTLDITIISDSAEENWVERPDANSALKNVSFKSNHKDSPVYCVKPSQMALERNKSRRPNERRDTIERLNDGFNYADASESFQGVSEWRHNAERMPLSEPYVCKRLSSRQVENKNNVYEENLVSGRKAHRGSELHSFSRGVHGQKSTSQTSGYQTDISLIPTTGVSEESALNVTYPVSGVDDIGSDYHTVPKSCKNLRNQTPTKFDANQTFNMNKSHSKTPLYHNDVSKLKNTPQKPLVFNQQRLMMARKKYKRPVNVDTLLLAQHDEINQLSQFALTNEIEGTRSRVNQWVKGHMEAQGADHCHFPSCPPKLPSNFLTCLSPSLSCTQIGLDLQGQRETPDCMSQTNKIPIMSRRTSISACDLCHSCQSPPTKLRKTGSFCYERSCHPICNTVSFIEKSCDCQDRSSTLELRPVSSPKRYSFYYTGKCRTETSISCNQSACDEEVRNLCLKDTRSSPHQHKPPSLMPASPCSEGKGSHFLLMNDAEFSQRVLQIVKNVKEYLNAESNIEGGTKNCTTRNNDSFTATTTLTPKRQASASSQHESCMFPEKYIDMFSPSNPHRIDSDEVTSEEQEEVSASLDFKQCLRSFRPRRNQKKHSYSQLPTTNTTSTATACEKSARTCQRDLFPGHGLGHDPLLSKSEPSTFKKPLPSVPRRKPPPAVTQDCCIPECREAIRSKKPAASTLEPLCPPSASLSHQGREFKENFDDRKPDAIEASDVNTFRPPLPFRASTPKPFSSAASQIYLDTTPTCTFEKRKPTAHGNPGVNPIYAPVPFRSSTPRPYSVSHHGICLNNSMSTIVAPSTCGALENVANDYTFSDVSSDSENGDPDQDISLVM